MNKSLVLGFISINLSALFISQGYAEGKYCPQNHQYIQVGMTPDQVIAACGKPASVEKLTHSLNKKVPMTQLIYNTTVPGQPYPTLKSAFYTQWSIPTGPNDTANTEMVVDIVDHKIHGIKIGNGSTNVSTLCQGVNIQGAGIPIKVGDNETMVYQACGSPDSVNQTYIDEPIKGKNPEVWTYVIDQYQPPMHLTFLNGRLESID